MASINYNDKRFANVRKKETADLKNVNNLYNSMVNNSDKLVEFKKTQTF